MKRYYPVLTIAGSDPSGGAGIQADLKTFSALGCYGMSAITAITVQNTGEVRAVSPVPPSVVEGQIRAVCDDIPPLSVKIGMLNDVPTVEAVDRALRDFLTVHPDTPVIIDPVMLSTSGAQLIDDDAIATMQERLFPLATLITPNVAETRRLTGGAVTLEEQLLKLRLLSCGNFLLKGGDSDTGEVKTDFFVTSGDGQPQVLALSSPAVVTVNTHGTGCTLSAAIASYAALGNDLVTAVKLAKKYVNEALTAGAGVTIGSGHGPVNHFYSPSRLRIYESEDQ